MKRNPFTSRTPVEVPQLRKKRIDMNKQEQEHQRRSFAYGNTKIENRDITPEAIELAASVIAEEDPR